jgi:pre-rRNA-processing protein TSR4
MADYDSDSSDGEFTETNVLLGYASKDAEEDTISKLGGRPVRPYRRQYRVCHLHV